MNKFLELKLEKLLERKKQLIDDCDLCDDGFVYKNTPSKEIDFHPTRKSCTCMKEFDRQKALISANIPEAFLEYEKLLPIECKEYLFKSDKLGYIKKFNKILRKYLRNKKVVIDNGLSMMFFGMNGSGKTFVATYILKKFIKMGHAGYYIHFRDLLAIYYSGISDVASRSLLKTILDVDVLCIDEIGKENKISNIVIAEFEYWLKSRNENMKPTLLITNRQVEDDEFKQLYGESVWDIFKTNYRLFMFDPDADMRFHSRKDWDKLLK